MVGKTDTMQRTGEHHGIDEFTQPFPSRWALRSPRSVRQINQSRALARDAPRSLAVPAKVDRWKFFAHGFVLGGTAACAPTGPAGMSEWGVTNGRRKFRCAGWSKESRHQAGPAGLMRSANAATGAGVCFTPRLSSHWPVPERPFTRDSSELYGCIIGGALGLICAIWVIPRF